MGVPGMQQLDRDRSRQNVIGGSPYLAEPADADFIIKDITTIEECRGNGHQRPLPSPPDSNRGAGHCQRAFRSSWALPGSKTGTPVPQSALP
jgi:hypothetical protein